MIYAAQGLLILFTILLASKDADAYSLFSFSDAVKAKKKLNAWHTKGAIIYVLLLAIAFYYKGSQLLLEGVLIRLSFYDVIFNASAGLDAKHMGTEAASDKYFSKLFGPNGAVKKAVIFFLILVALNVLNQIL